LVSEPTERFSIAFYPKGIPQQMPQGGYADFGVSHSNLQQVIRYIAEQEQHHKKTSFQDELRALLRKHEIEWDERYVWD